jgi:hypothetical protein
LLEGLLSWAKKGIEFNKKNSIVEKKRGMWAWIRTK